MEQEKKLVYSSLYTKIYSGEKEWIVEFSYLEGVVKFTLPREGNDFTVEKEEGD